MAKLSELVTELEKTNPTSTSNIAGYVRDGTFHYYVSKSENLPAAAAVLDTSRPFGALVYTNLKKTHWLYTYTTAGDDGGEAALAYVHDSAAAANDAKAITIRPRYKVVAGAGTAPGPIGGGLFQAAKDLRDHPTSYKTGPKLHTQEKGLHRALRYYMLAAYSVLGKCFGGSYNRGNYIAALMVDDSGKILSYGINSGWYHHGEVNMLLNYFAANAASGKFPSNTVIFSTLTPCLQCATYLQSTRPDDSIIFMGQPDTGGKGQVGERYGTYLRGITDPLSNRTLINTTKQVQVGTEVKKVWGKETVQPVYETRPDVKVEKYKVDDTLTSKMESGANIASQIGQKGGIVLSESLTTLMYKSTKGRAEGKEFQDNAVKKAVLAYLIGWVNSVGTSVVQIG
jgi:tRNA(Arg) A34 adenosine deaminase TadA